MATKHKNIYQAILSVMEAVNLVPETGQVSAGRSFYNYASDQDIIAALRPAMIENNIVMWPLDSEVISEGNYQTSSGTTMNRIRIKATYRFYHLDSDTFLDAVMIGEGSDNGDKAAFKADTGAQKYALRQVFTLAVGGDDPDATHSDNLNAATKGPRKQTKPAAAKNQTTTKPETKKEEATLAFDNEKLNRALKYKIPNGLPLENMEFSKVQQNTEVGPLVLLWIAGVRKSPKGEDFKPENEEQKAMAAAARYIVDFSPTFAKTLRTFKENNPELFSN